MKRTLSGLLAAFVAVLGAPIVSANDYYSSARSGNGNCGCSSARTAYRTVAAATYAPVVVERVAYVTQEAPVTVQKQVVVTQQAAPPPQPQPQVEKQVIIERQAAPPPTVVEKQTIVEKQVVVQQAPQVVEKVYVQQTAVVQEPQVVVVAREADPCYSGRFVRDIGAGDPTPYYSSRSSFERGFERGFFDSRSRSRGFERERDFESDGHFGPGSARNSFSSDRTGAEAVVNATRSSTNVAIAEADAPSMSSLRIVPE